MQMKQLRQLCFTDEQNLHMSRVWYLESILHTSNLNNQLTSCSWVPLPEWIASQIMNIFCALYEIRGFITVFTRARQWYVSRARWIQFTHIYFLTTHFKVILPSTSRSSKLSVSFRFFLFETVRFLFCVFPATCPAHLIVLRFIVLAVFDEEYRARSFFCVREGLTFKCKCINP